MHFLPVHNGTINTRLFLLRAIAMTLIIAILLWMVTLSPEESLFWKDQTEKSIDDAAINQKQRQERLRMTCRRYNMDSQSLRHGHLKYILVDDKRRFLYCLVQKVASTNWKRVLMLLSGKISSEDVVRLEREQGHARNPSRFVHNMTFYSSLGIRSLHQYNKMEVRYRLDNYFKFMFVRNPFHRLVSTYRDKFTLKDYFALGFQKKYGRVIVAKYKENATKRALKTGRGVTFKEFIQYLADTPRGKYFRTFNVHWQTYNNLCFPCGVKYDFVGHLETLNQDVNYVFSRIAPELVGDRNVLFPSALTGPSHYRYQHGTDLPTPMQMFNDIPSDTLAKLLTIYSADFDIHGYHPLSLQHDFNH